MDKYSTATEAAYPDERQTFVSPLNNACSDMRKHVEHLRALTERMVGAEPAAGSAGSGINKLNSVPSGLFDDVRRQGNDLNEMLTEAEQLLGRIERALP